MWRDSSRLRPVVSRLSAAVRTRFEIDTRSLAVFRIALALLVVVDLLLRARNFELFYTDSGVVPQTLALAAEPAGVPSIYFLSTDPRVTAGLFILHGLAACCLLVGYRTRLSTVLVAVFVVSLDLRNPLVLSYADTLFMWLLFWAIFLPLGERWSVDAVHAAKTPRSTVGGLPAALLLLQVVAVYFVNAIHKTESTRWPSGEAALLVMELDDMTFLAAELVASVPRLLQAGGTVWFGLLAGSWLLVVLRGRPRTALIGLFVFAHLSFGLTVRIGAFAFVSIAGLLVFLQASFWNDLAALSDRGGFASFLSTASQRLARVAASVPPGPEPMVDVFGWLESHRGRVRMALAGVVLCVLAVALLAGGGVVDSDGPAGNIEKGVGLFVEHQTEWTIFAPEPRTTVRQYVIAAETAEGHQRDLAFDRELTADRPDDLHRQFDSYRERFYFSSVRRNEPAGSQQLFAEYLCRTERVDGEPLDQLTLYVISEQVTLETLGKPADRERTIQKQFSHSCGDDNPEPVTLPA